MKNSWILFFIFLFLKIFLWLKFDVPCPSFHQYGRRSEFFQPCLYLNFDMNHGGFFSCLLFILDS